MVQILTKLKKGLYFKQKIVHSLFVVRTFFLPGENFSDCFQYLFVSFIIYELFDSSFEATASNSPEYKKNLRKYFTSVLFTRVYVRRTA